MLQPDKFNNKDRKNRVCILMEHRCDFVATTGLPTKPSTVEYVSKMECR